VPCLVILFAAVFRYCAEKQTDRQTHKQSNFAENPTARLPSAWVINQVIYMKASGRTLRV